MNLRDIYQEWVYENGSYKLVALFITLILWVSVLGRKETTVSKEIPVQFVTSSDRIITSAPVKSVSFDLSGSRRSLKRFATEKTAPIRVDIAEGAVGRIIVSVPEDSVKLPFGVKVVGVRPPSLIIDVDEVAQKKVPIVINWQNPKEQNAILMEAKVIPSEITIEGGKAALEKIREVLTAEIESDDAQIIDGRRVIDTKLKFPEIEGLRPMGEVPVKVIF